MRQYLMRCIDFSSIVSFFNHHVEKDLCKPDDVEEEEDVDEDDDLAAAAGAQLSSSASSSSSSSSASSNSSQRDSKSSRMSSGRRSKVDEFDVYVHDPCPDPNVYAQQAMKRYYLIFWLLFLRFFLSRLSSPTSFLLGKCEERPASE